MPMRTIAGLAALGLILSACNTENDSNNTPNLSVQLQLLEREQMRERIINALPVQIAAAQVTPTPAATIRRSRDGVNYGNLSPHTDGEIDNLAIFNGSHWYLAHTTSPSVHIISVLEDTPPSISGHITLDGPGRQVSQMYTVEQPGGNTYLATIREQSGQSSAPNNVWPTPNSGVRLQIIDTTIASSPQEIWDLRIEGTLSGSHKIGDTLYLMTSYHSWVEALNASEYNQQTIDDNATLLNATDLSQLLPKHQLGDTEAQITNQACYTQENLVDTDSATFFSLIAVDLASQTIIGGTCLQQDGPFYWSVAENTLYLAQHSESSAAANTNIHKFELTETGMLYTASGSIPGHLRFDPGLVKQAAEGARLDQSGNLLRAITTNASGEHDVLIVDQQGSSLDIIARLADDAQQVLPSGAILHAHFQDKYTYIVTENQLYTLDLTDSQSPRVHDESSLSWVPSALQTLNENYLIAIGYTLDTAIGVKVKVGLLDVSSGSAEFIDTIELGFNPKENGNAPTGTASNIIPLFSPIPARWQAISEATYDTRALSLTHRNNGQIYIAIPLTVKSVENPYIPEETFLQLIEIDEVSSAQPRFALAGTLEPQLSARTMRITSPLPTHSRQRSIFSGDTVLYTHTNTLWAMQLSDPNSPINTIELSSPE